MTHAVPKFVIDAFYESKFRDNLFIIKAGGKIIEDQKILDNLISNIHDLTRIGIKILLVYGFGRAVDEKSKAAGLKVTKIEGRRVTDAATLQVIKDIVGGELSLNISQSMARNHLPGVSLNAVPADWMKIELRDKKPVDFGFVGNIKSVEPRSIQRMFRVSNFIACSCLGVTPDGTVCNINADTIATQIAIAMKAHKLIFLSDVDGVQVNGKPADIITADEIPGLIENGTVTGGMRIKLENCFAALKAGVRRIHLLSGLRENALESEIYEPVGPGTMLLAESERASYLNEIEALKVIEAQKFATAR
jgi:acetylglutamate kinase